MGMGMGIGRGGRVPSVPCGFLDSSPLRHVHNWEVGQWKDRVGRPTATATPTLVPKGCRYVANQMVLFCCWVGPFTTLMVLELAPCAGILALSTTRYQAELAVRVAE